MVFMPRLTMARCYTAHHLEDLSMTFLLCYILLPDHYLNMNFTNSLVICHSFYDVALYDDCGMITVVVIYRIRQSSKGAPPKAAACLQILKLSNPT
jgi:hypothetical protein